MAIPMVTEFDITEVGLLSMKENAKTINGTVGEPNMMKMVQ